MLVKILLCRGVFRKWGAEQTERRGYIFKTSENEVDIAN